MIEILHKPRKRSRFLRFWRPYRPKVFAIFAFRYDAHLVPAFLQNIEPFVDGWVSYDDRKSTKPLTTDPERQIPMIEAAHAAGADWILALDPDHRVEDRFTDKIDELTSERGRFAWSFRLREMYSPTEYRTDGLWGKKRRRRLYPIYDDLFPIAERGSFPTAAFHASFVPNGYGTRQSGVNIYHLKMLTAERRKARRDIYKAVDPGMDFQTVGYDYLADDTGAEFKSIRPGREYSPPHVEDGGLWMPEPAQVVNSETYRDQ
jgi:hypothetical protein